MLNSELNGEIRMKSFLVGTPVIRISLNEDIDLCEKQSKQAGWWLNVVC